MKVRIIKGTSQIGGCITEITCNNTKIIIDYGLDNMDDNNVIEEMRELAVINKKNINTNIKFNDMEFLVESTYYVKGVFSNIFRTKGYLVKSRYKGYIDSNNKKRLVKLK